jgi:cbb3-type cytochrome oxidase subunit 3
MLKLLVTTHSAETGLVLFVICFAAITIYAITRTRNELDRWSDLPLNDSDVSATHPGVPEEHP